MARAATTSDVFNAIAEQQRREILGLLRADEGSVNELAQELGISQPGASKHLRVLREVGLVRDRKAGKQRLYGLDARGLRTVIYVNIFPNVLLSLHPDYVMTHLIVPVAADRTRIECTWSFAPEAVARPDFDPRYAVEFWDITNRQDWAACESVQRGLASPHSLPGPLAPNEDAVYSFVTTIARGYLGQSVWGTAGVA